MYNSDVVFYSLLMMMIVVRSYCLLLSSDVIMQRYRHKRKEKEKFLYVYLAMILMTFMTEDNPYSNDDTIGEHREVFFSLFIVQI